MFDPSKLDLDLDNTGEENNNKKAVPETKKEAISKEVISEQIKEKPETQDVLGNLNVPDKKEEKKVINNTEATEKEVIEAHKAEKVVEKIIDESKLTVDEESI